MILSTKYYEDYRLCIDSVPNLDRLNNSKILVTGGCGLIGSSLVDFLIVLNDKKNTNNTIYVGARNQERYNARFKTYEGRDDICFFKYDAEEIIDTEIDFDYIIHAANPATPSWFSERPAEVMSIIIQGTKNVLDYAKKHHVKKIIYISSSEVYGNKDDSNAYTEDEYGFVDILNPRSCYPVAKRAAETMCAAYIKEFGLDISIVRPGHIYGPTMTKDDVRASSAFLRDVLEQRNIIMKSAGQQLRSYTYVADCSSAILAVLINGINGESYNISNRDSVVTIRQYAEMLASCAEKEIVFDNPSDKEKQGYNLMDNSSLNAAKLEGLGWIGVYDLKKGIESSLEALINE